ncbi:MULTISPECIES: hypothetical protein [unclassified Ruminococcus]|uniref:hypothetical protein n=1 Tax=unclassified Ruminococcus TaxID=2608920 RepID=UPI00210A3A3E|nr:MULTISPECIES: hypothetical protein [unclassified Ruminococcus]MCQ4022952.1 hypothetical protein [Ruminococcus sp. zg-924]MCQ4115350.1 hypothetical protein [Ruminococcus sp. zg-921]
MEIILSAVITVMLYAAGVSAILFAQPLRQRLFAFADTGKLIRRAAIVCGANLAVVLLCGAFVKFLTTAAVTVPIFVYVVFAVACFFGFVLGAFAQKCTSKLLKACALLCIIPFLLEIFVFNAKSVDLDKSRYTPSPSQYQILSTDTVQQSNGSFEFSGDGSILINVNSENIGAAHLNFSGSDNMFNCSLLMADENSSKVRIAVGEKKTSAKYQHTDFVLKPYGTLYSLTISLSDIKNPVTLTSVELSSAVPFEFSALRFFVLMAVGIVVYLIYHFKLYKTVYDRRKRLHKVAVAFALLLCLLSTLLFIAPHEQPIAYTPSSVAGSDHYVQMFDAVMKGQANLDLPVDNKLLTLENPYDSSVRAESGVSAYWDRAFYNGQYFSYFGIVPVLTFYMPFYFATSKLPTMNMTAFFFAALAIIFLFGTVLTVVKRFVKKPNMLLLIAGLITAVFSGGIFYALYFSNVYFNAVLSALSFLLLSLWTAFASYENKSVKKQLVLLFISGLSFILCVGCRPTMALCALILAPVFIHILLRRDYSLKRKIVCAGVFLAPVIIGAAALMWYNYIRFGSLFEFGATYQLTVNDIHANKVSILELPSAIINYFLRPMDFISQFPHIEMSNIPIANQGHYVYNKMALGIISFPSIVLGLVLLPLVMKNHIKGAKRLKSHNRVKFSTYLIIAVLSVVIIWLDYCMAGVTFRYLLDILPSLSILAILVFLECNSNFATTPSLQNKSTLLCCISMAASIVLVALQLLSFGEIEVGSLFKRFPNILFEAQRLVEFWC